MPFSVTQRTREIGIRLAVGAQSRDIFQMIVGQGIVLALMGVAIGSVAAFALTCVLSSLLCGASATDPATLIWISLLVTGVALLACYIPARRATRVDPIVGVRYE